MQYTIAVIDGLSGKLLSVPMNLQKNMFWGRRDDSFKTTFKNTVMWVYGNPDTNLLYIGKIN